MLYWLSADNVLLRQIDILSIEGQKDVHSVFKCKNQCSHWLSADNVLLRQIDILSIESQKDVNSVFKCKNQCSIGCQQTMCYLDK